MKCKDNACCHNINGECIRIGANGQYGICWMAESEGEY